MGNKKMKKFLLVILCLIFAFPLVACGEKKPDKVTVHFKNSQGDVICASITADYLSTIQLPKVQEEDLVTSWTYNDERLDTYWVVKHKGKEVTLVLKYYCIVTFQLEEGKDFAKIEVEHGGSISYEELPKPPHTENLELDYIWPDASKEYGIRNITTNKTIVAIKSDYWSPTV